MRKIIIASDSFKGSLSSLEVANAAAKGIKTVFPDCATICLDIADGGEGTSSTLTKALGGNTESVTVSDPLGRPVTASYGIAETSYGRTAIIEMSQASGLTLIPPKERNPLLTSTYGTGEMIMDAYRKGCRRFMVGIGGSATNDGGTGMFEALGAIFIDTDGRRMSRMCGGSIGSISRIDTAGIPHGLIESEFIVACDVETVFCGPEGAAAVFGPQKGATPDMVATLEQGMQHLNRIILQDHGMDLSKVKGSGAAGGLGGSFKAFLNARLNKGIDMVLEAIGFEEKIQNADLIITGEGKIDSQTGKGKVISGITSIARKHNIPVIAIAGIVDMDKDEARECGLAGIFAIGPRPQNESDLEYAMRSEVASKNISETVAKALVSLSPSLYHGSL